MTKWSFLALVALAAIILLAKKPKRAFVAAESGSVSAEVKPRTNRASSTDVGKDDSAQNAGQASSILDKPSLKPSPSAPHLEKIVLKARALFSSRHVDEALDLLTAYAKQHPKDDKALEELADLSRRAGKDVSEVMGWLQKAIEANPQNSAALGEMLDLLESTDQEAEIEPLLTDIVSRCDACPDASLALGDVLLGRNEDSQAILEFKRAATFPAVREAALRRLYNAFLKTGDKEEASLALREVIKIAEAHLRTVESAGERADALRAGLARDQAALRELRQSKRDI